jgi:hypothetical protein
VKIKISVGGQGNRPLSVETQYKLADPNNKSPLVQF